MTNTTNLTDEARYEAGLHLLWALREEAEKFASEIGGFLDNSSDLLADIRSTFRGMVRLSDALDATGLVGGWNADDDASRRAYAYEQLGYHDSLGNEELSRRRDLYWATRENPRDLDEALNLAYSHVAAGIERALEVSGLDAKDRARLERMLDPARHVANHRPAPAAPGAQEVRDEASAPADDQADDVAASDSLSVRGDALASRTRVPQHLVPARDVSTIEIPDELLPFLRAAAIYRVDHASENFDDGALREIAHRIFEPADWGGPAGPAEKLAAVDARNLLDEAFGYLDLLGDPSTDAPAPGPVPARVVANLAEDALEQMRWPIRKATENGTIVATDVDTITKRAYLMGQMIILREQALALAEPDVSATAEREAISA